MRLIIVLILLCLASCAKALTGTEPTTDKHNLTGPQITYLGVGGWLLYWHGEGLLLAPSFSIPSVPPILVRSDKQRIADMQQLSVICSSDVDQPLRQH